MKSKKAKLPDYPANGASIQAQAAIDSEPQHTPTPWELREKWIFPKGKDDDICMLSQSYQRSGNERYANGEFIVRAVNSHEELLGALRDAYEALERAEFNNEQTEGGKGFYGSTAKKVWQAIAKAEGK